MRQKREILQLLTRDELAIVERFQVSVTDRRSKDALVDAVASSKKAMLTVDRLEGYLWSAADILRGSIDSSDYKNSIFGILFLKRLSDRFDEECEILLKEGDDPEEKDLGRTL
jgi:hypothetical protein